MTDRQRLVDQLVRHEGFTRKPYVDTVGKITIGVGRNLSDVGISSEEAFVLLDHDIDAAMHDCATFPWFTGLTAVRQRVLVDMMFNLGASRLGTFTGMLHALAVGDYEGASLQMLMSAWAKQVGIRATDLALMMKTGEDHLA